LKPSARRRYSFYLPDAAAEWAGAALSDIFPDGLLLHPHPGGVTRLRGWRAAISAGDEARVLKRLRALGASRASSVLEKPQRALALHGRFPILRVGPFRLVPKAQAKAGLQKDGDIILVQGQAFGTGRHESTRLMVESLRRESLTDVKVLDVGAGSGVLGFAALQLGAASVTNVEQEGPACTELRENRALNHVSPAAMPVIHASYPIARLKGRRYGIVLGNLITPVLTTLMPHLARHVAPAGTLLCSGIHTAPEAAAVTAAAKAAGLKAAGRRSLRRWYVLRFVRS
jgi:ribosomal protein L11 methyltransferase